MHSQELSDGLTLRSLHDEHDKARFAAFNALYNNAAEGATCTVLTHHHPEMTPDDFWIVESDATREIVSTTCLIPWTLRFAGLDLRAAQLEMVLTRPDFRGRGLVRAQMQHFDNEVQKRGCDLALIWGIPYYYRQYGYAYAIEGATAETLPVWRIPSATAEHGPAIRMRPAVLPDIPTLTNLHDRVFNKLDLSVKRGPAYWRYLLEAAHHPIELIENTSTGVALGYAVVLRTAATAQILENVLPDALTALAVLQILKSQIAQQVQVSWPANTVLATLTQQLGSQTMRGGQWLVRVPNVALFLTKMHSIFEQRLAKSAWLGLSTQITLNLFREAFRLRFEHGELMRVDALGFVDSSMGTDGGDLCIPPEAFLRLLFGYRALEDLFDAWPDILVKPEARSVIQTLFPRLQPFLYAPYHDLGAPT